jgi:hypothetical protein
LEVLELKNKMSALEKAIENVAKSVAGEAKALHKEIQNHAKSIKRANTLLEPVDKIVKPLEKEASELFQKLDEVRARTSWLVTANLVVTGIASTARAVSAQLHVSQSTLTTAALWCLDQPSTWWAKVDNSALTIAEWAQLVLSQWQNAGSPNRPLIRALTNEEGAWGADQEDAA